MVEDDEMGSSGNFSQKSPREPDVMEKLTRNMEKGESGSETKAGSWGPGGVGGWRMEACMVACFGAVVAVILWLFFYAGGYNVYQNIAVVGATFLACMAVMAAIMGPWFMRRGSRWGMMDNR